MSTVLHINASGSLTGSRTRAATDILLQDLSPAHVITRDLATDPLPQVDQAWIDARLVDHDTRTADQTATLAQSMDLIAEIKAADTLLIGMPIYNFAMPASLKLWIDLIAVPKVTFAYTEKGPVGLLENKKAIVAVASGGVPIGTPMDFATPHLEQVLRFIGITDITMHNAQDVLDQAA